MATIIANDTFTYAGNVYTHGVTYDTANAAVNAANTAVPHKFYATGGTKTAQDTFVFRDTRAGGVERFVYKGEVLPSGDQACTADTNHVK